MRFDHFTLISTFLFASAVLADRSHEHRSSQSLDVVEKRTSATSDSVEVVGNFAGAVLHKDYATYRNITGVITVPFIWGKTGAGVSIWIGLDVGPGDTQCGSMFTAGLICTINSNGPVYTGKAVLNLVGQWFPDAWIEFTDVKVSYGDVVKVTVGVSDEKTGYATVEKLGDGTNKNIVQTRQFNALYGLCQRSAGWIVEKMVDRDLAYFGFVPFTQPAAYGEKELNAGGSAVYDITREDGLPLTAVEAYGDVIRVIQKYL